MSNEKILDKLGKIKRMQESAKAIGMEDVLLSAGYVARYIALHQENILKMYNLTEEEVRIR